MAIPKANSSLASLTSSPTINEREKGDNEDDNDGRIITARELIEKMREVNESVKANKFTTILGGQIHDVCQMMKCHGMGKEMEETHKNELNKFFAAIRRAACHEGNSLGLPCRLKMMELLELRAMGWRTNLSSANYYAKRESAMPTKTITTGIEEAQRNTNMNNVKSAFDMMMNKSSDFMLNNQTNFVGTTAQSPPQQQQQQPSPIIPFLPFTIPLPPAHPPPPAILPGNFQSAPQPSSCLVALPDSPNMSPTTGFYFIPSRAGTFMPANMATSPPHPFAQQQSLFGGGGGGGTTQLVPTPFPLFANPKFKANIFDGMSVNETLFTASTKNSKILASQMREEVTIRNSDSGKVMGVKGRRVALIEEISKTVISFQRVDPKSKERQLTIIADGREAIEWAKKLIAETIERNVSPERPVEHVDHCQREGSNSNENNGTNILDDGIPPPIKEDAKNAMVECPAAPMTTTTILQIRVDKQADGSLKVVSNDPSMLEAAQAVLSEYLRKCMAGNGNDGDDGDTNQELEKKNEGKCRTAMKKKMAPEDSHNTKNGIGTGGGTISYDRQTMLKIRSQQEERRDGGRQTEEEEMNNNWLLKKLANLDIFVAQQQLH